MIGYDRLVRGRQRLRALSTAADELGGQMKFFVDTVGHTPTALRHYRKDVLRLIAEIGMGTGALAVIGGTVVIVASLTLFTGGTIAIQGYSSLGDIGIESLTGFLAAFINVRVAAPVVAGIGLSATIGAGSTAQLGAMRIAEEIDALDSMGIRPLPPTRQHPAHRRHLVIILMYSAAVIASFYSAVSSRSRCSASPAGFYDHYFRTFLQPGDLLWSFLPGDPDGCGGDARAYLLRLHRIRRGPRGVGRAVGRAVRTSLIVVVCVTLLISLAVYGPTGNFHLSG